MAETPGNGALQERGNGSDVVDVTAAIRRASRFSDSGGPVTVEAFPSEFAALFDTVASLRSQLLEARAETETTRKHLLQEYDTRVAAVRERLAAEDSLVDQMARHTETLRRYHAAESALRSLREGVEGLDSGKSRADCKADPYNEGYDDGYEQAKADVLRLIPAEPTDGG